MPVNKKESLIFTIMMCAFMVFFMSIYNISRIKGLSFETVKEAWIGFPLAYVVGIICDWFIVSGPAKKLAFKIVGYEAATIKKVMAVSGCMVCGMVLLMSLYGAVVAVGFSEKTLLVWLINIPFNLIMALPLQIVVAGPFVRFVFRKAFPMGTISCVE